MSKKKLNIADVKNIIEEAVPVELQEEWDNSGLNIGFENDEVRKILICLEINDDVMNEAVLNNVNLIITHHPLIFGSIKSINDADYQNRIIIKGIQNKISVYSCHTPFDKVKGGNNDYILKLLGINKIKNITETIDIGRIGELNKVQTFKELIYEVVNVLNLSIDSIRTVGALETEIKKIGICTGAGADLAQMAHKNGCQAFITGDVKYHEAQTALQQGLCIIDAGHYGTEKFFPEAMQLMIQDKLGEDIEILISRIDLNPFN